MKSMRTYFTALSVWTLRGCRTFVKVNKDILNFKGSVQLWLWTTILVMSVLSFLPFIFCTLRLFQGKELISTFGGHSWGDGLQQVGKLFAVGISLTFTWHVQTSSWFLSSFRKWQVTFLTQARLLSSTLDTHLCILYIYITKLCTKVKYILDTKRPTDIFLKW